MTHINPVIVESGMIPYFNITFTNTLPEGETEFSFSFESRPGYDGWEVISLETVTDWEIKPDGWFETIIELGNEIQITKCHHLNQIIHLEFNRVHVMKPGSAQVLKLRGRGICLTDKL